MMDRRNFLKRLGVLTGGAVTLVMVEGCHDFSGTHQKKTMNALFDTLLPSTPGSPGAVDCEAYEFYTGGALLKAAVNLGLLPAAIGTFGVQASQFLAATVANRLDAATLRHEGVTNPLDGRVRTIHFADRARSTQEAIVGKAIAGSFAGAPVVLLPQVMEVTRIAAILSYTAAVRNDRGLVAMGWPPYLDFAKRRHNNGYAVFSYNKTPVALVDGRWRVARGEGLPDGNPS